MSETQTPPVVPSSESQSTKPAQTAPAGAAEFGQINTRALAADAAKLQCFKDAVLLIDAHSVAYVDAESPVRRLKPGTLATLKQLLPALNSTTLSTAWTAYTLDASAFAACTSQRGFVDIVKSHKESSAAAAQGAHDTMAVAVENLMESALEHAKEAIKEAASVGISAATLADLIRLAYTKPAPVAQTSAPATVETPAK